MGKYKRFRDFGHIEKEVIERFIKRNEPMKVVKRLNKKGHIHEYCENCDIVIFDQNDNYCCNCGQKLDWTEGVGGVSRG